MTTQNPTHWYFIENKQALGPFSLEQMRAGTAQGKIKHDTLVCPAGEQSWTPAKNWPTLFPPQPPAFGVTNQPPPLRPSSPSPPTYQAFPIAVEVPHPNQQDTFKIVHWVGTGILAVLFLARVIYFFRDKQINSTTLYGFVFNNDFSWPVLLPQFVLALALAWFLQPRAKWMLIAVVVVLFFSFLGSFAMIFEALRQRRTQPLQG